MSPDQLPPVVTAIQKLHIEGNVIPHSWYQHIKTEAGMTDLVAITILSDILYWYRPAEIRDEISGKQVGWKKRFSSDKLQRSYEAYESLFGLTKRQAKDAFHRLEKAGLITMEFRSFNQKGQFLANVLFVEPLPGAIEKITYSTIGQLPDKLHMTNKRHMTAKRDTSTGNPSYHLPEIRQTNTEITTRDYTETNHVPPVLKPPKSQSTLIENYFTKKASNGLRPLSPIDREEVKALVEQGFTLERCKPGIDKVFEDFASKGKSVGTFRLCVNAIVQLDPERVKPTPINTNPRYLSPSAPVPMQRPQFKPRELECYIETQQRYVNEAYNADKREREQKRLDQLLLELEQSRQYYSQYSTIA